MMLKMTRNKWIGLGSLLALALAIILAYPTLVIGRTQLAPTGNAIGVVCTENSSATFNLQTTTGFISLPDGNQVFMWGFAETGNAFQAPGPILCVNQGDTVTINLTNTLGEPTSIIFPGQMGVTASGGSVGLLTDEAAANGGTASYSFVAGEPGTYLYESGTEQHKQIHMGLYGAIIVRPSLGADYAYNDASTRFDPDKEYLLLLHEIDPVLHRAVQLGQPYDITTRHDRYWTIKGRSLPDTLNDNGIAWMPSQPYGALVQVEANAALPALVRYANAGTVNHPFHPHGDHLKMIGQDGRYMGAASIESFTRTIAAGQTADLLFSWDNVENWSPPGSSGPIPVTLPGLLDVVFKDDVTFYSGDPYLGQTGDLPSGVTTYNQCGEFYYPWHSHALNEVQNFDEGFGGLMTLVRVDPPGGCP